LAPVCVLLLDDSPAFVQAAASFLAAVPGVEVVGTARSTAEALRTVAEAAPDVVLATLELPGSGGLVAAVRLKSLPRPPHVVVLSDHEEPPYRGLAEAVHADAFVLKRDFCTHVPPILRQLSRSTGEARAAPPEQPYGDPTEWNTARLVLDSVGKDMLTSIVGEYLEPLGTSTAVFEKNGDYALAVFASGWCRKLNAASRTLGGAGDHAAAVAGGRWHCHESCWAAARKAIETAEAVDEACPGGIRIHAVPIRAGAEVVGAISLGYSSPPADPLQLGEIADRYALPVLDLQGEAVRDHPRSAFLVGPAKRRLATAARLIGEIVRRSQAERTLLQRTRLATLSADVGLALTRTGGVRDMLRQCAESIVRTLDAAFARIWTLDPGADTLELQASAGIYTSLNGTHKRIPVGRLKIGLIALERTPHLTNDVLNDPRVGDPDWARREGMVAFAGYPLLVDERVVGVMAMFARQPLTGFVLEALGQVADVIALGLERKRSREALGRSEDRLRSFIAGAQDVIFEISAGGAFLSLNPAFESVTGWGAAEWVGQPFLPLVHADDAPRAADLFARVMAGETPPRFETRLNTRSGGAATVEVSVTPWAEGGAVGVQGIARDVTDRKQAEEALRLRDRAIQAVPQGILITDASRPGNPITYASTGFERLTGYTAAEYLGRDCRFLQGKDTDPAAVARVRAAIESGQPCVVEVLNYRKDGSAFWNELSITPVVDPAGRPTHFVGVQTDVTERRHREDELRRNAEVLRAVFGHIPVMIAFIGTDFTLKMVNRQWELVLGWTFEEARALDVIAEMYPDAGERRRVLDSIRRPPPGWAAFRTRTREGRTLETEWANVPLSDGTCIVFGLDVTGRTELEQQFRQSQKMEAVGRLAGGVAHDFNNLLTVINGYSDMVLDALPAGDPQRQFVAAVRDAGDRAARLTQQLLAFSRKAVVEPKVLELNELVTESGKLIRRLIGEDIALAVVPDSGPVWVEADPGQIEQVVMNLAVNARDAMPTGGRLTVETRTVTVGGDGLCAPPGVKPGRYARLSVADTGLGMTEEVRNKVFEPFFTTKGVGRGTGLGLAVVHGVVAQCGGHIGVVSTPGVGTTFTLLFPVAMKATTGSGSGVVRLGVRGTETVLLVEDEEAVRTIARIALTMHGFTVLDAGHGADAIRLAADHPGPIHLLLTDVVMPEIGGRQLVEAVRAHRPGVRVLYTSGYTDDAVVHHGVGSSDAFLQKPFTPLELARKVRFVLDGGA
jgi:PAS domain S-box-containing protein